LRRSASCAGVSCAEVRGRERERDRERERGSSQALREVTDITSQRESRARTPPVMNSITSESNIDESMPASDARLRRSGAMASFLLGRGCLPGGVRGNGAKKVTERRAPTTFVRAAYENTRRPVLSISSNVHKHDGVVALGAAQRLVELGLHQVPDVVKLVFALAKREAAVGRVVHADVLDLTARPARHVSVVWKAPSTCLRGTTREKLKGKFPRTHSLEGDGEAVLLGGAHAQQEGAVLVGILQALHGLLTRDGAVVVAAWRA
jgi:hypothetical protein